MIIDGNIDGHCSFCENPSHIFHYLSEESIALLDNSRFTVHYKPNETIFKKGSPLTHVVSFDHGLAKMQYHVKDDKDHIIRLVKPIEFIAGIGLFLDNKHHYTLTAIEKSSVCMFDSNVYKQILKNNPVFNEVYLNQVHQLMEDTFRKMISLSHKNALGRIAESILYLSDDIYRSDVFTTNLTKIELAEMSGVSRESAFKALRELFQSEIMNFEGNQINILNKEKLRKISNAG